MASRGELSEVRKFKGKGPIEDCIVRPDPIPGLRKVGS